MEDDAETKGRIKETVLKILEESGLDKLTMYTTRMQAFEQLGLDLSQPHYKSFVKQVVDAFLQEKEQQMQQQEEEKYDCHGNLIICKKRMVTVHEFKGKTLISIREYKRRAGKEYPTRIGISLTKERWLALKKNVPAIEEAIEKLESGNI